MLTRLLEGIRSFIGGPPLSGEEGRDRARILCRYRVLVSSRVDGQPSTGSVVDISRTGMRLEGLNSVSRGETLWISFADQSANEDGSDVGPVQVEVMWSRKRAHDGVRLTGVRYMQTGQLGGTWVQSIFREVGLSQDESSFMKRRHIRLATSLRADLRDQSTGETLAQGKVANLSVGGTLVESESALADNTAVMVIVSPYNNFPVFSIPAVVLNCRYDEDEGINYVSLQFVKVTAEQLKTLKRLIFNLLKGRAIG